MRVRGLVIVLGLALKAGAVLIRTEDTKHGHVLAIPADLIQKDMALNRPLADANMLRRRPPKRMVPEIKQGSKDRNISIVSLSAASWLHQPCPRAVQVAPRTSRELQPGFVLHSGSRAKAASASANSFSSQRKASSPESTRPFAISS